MNINEKLALLRTALRNQEACVKTLGEVLVITERVLLEDKASIENAQVYNAAKTALEFGENLKTELDIEVYQLEHDPQPDEIVPLTAQSKGERL